VIIDKTSEMMYEISISIDSTSNFDVATPLLSEFHLMHKADGEVTSARAWILAFGGFAGIFGPLLLGRPPERGQGAARRVARLTTNFETVSKRE
jgi:hypothetical protein